MAEWYTEKSTGISFIRLKSVGNKALTDSINAALQALHFSSIQKYFSGRVTGIVATICFLNQWLLSFQVKSTRLVAGIKAEHSEI